MYSAVLLLALGSAPSEVLMPLHNREGNIPHGAVPQHSYFEYSLSQPPVEEVVVVWPAVTVVNRAPGPTPALLRVVLPADARLTIDGNPTRSPGEARLFVSPPLEPGRRYVYILRAEVVRDGKKVVETREVPVRAGEESEVTLTFPARQVAGK